jgi:hypothetical protein
MKISKEQALQIATSNGFFATWTTLALKNKNWHIFGFSKSARAPAYFVIAGIDGTVLYKNQNSNVEKVPAEYHSLISTEVYEVGNSERPTWIESKFQK